MKTILLFTSLAAIFPQMVLGDFSGGDPLAKESSKWASFTDYGKPGGGNYVFQNSRLEFLVNSPTTKDLSIIRWTPNEGAYNQDWFIQVDVHLDKVPLNKSSHTNLNLGVVDSGNHDQGYFIAIDRYRTDGGMAMYVSGFETSSVNGLNDDYQKSPALDATLRVHFDSTAKTLTGSWKSGTVWRYLPSTRITDWRMGKSGTFTTVLAAAGGGRDDGSGIGPVIKSGDAYFSNFRTGAAKPDIAIEQPSGSDLTDGRAKKSFGSVAIGGEGLNRTFIIRNSGTATLRNLNIAKGGPDAADFTVIEPVRTLIRPGASTTFKVVFKPKATGARNAIINVISNDPDESHFDIQLTGMGTVMK